MTSGGVAGVTLFFVLSGYLIASLLLRERAETGTLDLSRFYARRAWRLLPALVTVMAFLLVLGLIAGHQALVEDSLLTFAYVANWARAMGDPMGWWNHAWSLSIEEQFYLVAPVALLVVTRVAPPGSRTLIGYLALAVVVSTFWRATVIGAGASGGRIYFGTDTRMDALLLGCLLAAIHARAPRWTPSPWIGPMSLLVVGLLAVLPLVDTWLGGIGYSLMAVASAGVVAGALRDDQRWTGLDRRPLVWLGERSYSLYLVHVPVLLVANHAFPTVEPALRAGTGVLAAVALSALLFRYVERPTRHGIGSSARPARSAAPRRVGAMTRIGVRPEP